MECDKCQHHSEWKGGPFDKIHYCWFTGNQVEMDEKFVCPDKKDTITPILKDVITFCSSCNAMDPAFISDYLYQQAKQFESIAFDNKPNTDNKLNRDRLVMQYDAETNTKKFTICDSRFCNGCPSHIVTNHDQVFFCKSLSSGFVKNIIVVDGHEMIIRPEECKK